MINTEYGDDGRRKGKSKLVYNKSTRTIDTVLAIPSGTFAEGVEAAAKVAQKRAEGFHTGECDRGHVEWDTNAFVCSNRNGCLCAEREEEAEAIAIAIRALTPPLPPEVRGDEMSATADRPSK